MAWVEGLTTARTIVRDIANVLVTSEKDVNGNRLIGKNWDIVHPVPDTTPVTGETLTLVDASKNLFRTAHAPIKASSVAIYVGIAAPENLIPSTEYFVVETDGSIIFSTDVYNTQTLIIDYQYHAAEQINNAINSISDHAVLRTTIIGPQGLQDGSASDPNIGFGMLTVYVEFEQPARLINPETGLDEYTAVDGSVLGTDPNYHYINVRVFDIWDEVNRTPAAGAKVSNWSKFAWYRDFKEYLKDELDTDAGSTNLNDGITLQQVKISGINENSGIYYWINANNERAIIVLQGDPVLSSEDFLCSVGYFGKIDSFDNSNPDITGNFAFTVSSSTIPCFLSSPPTGQVDVIDVTASTTSGGTLKTDWTYAYIVTYTTESGESKVGEPKAVYVNNSNAQSAVQSNTITFTLPPEATGFKVYRASYYGNRTTNTVWLYNLSNYKFLTSSNNTAATSWTDDGSITPGTTSPSSKGVPVRGVARDSNTGRIVSIIYPTNYGSNTATGVTDIAMFKSRSGVYYQKHHPAFLTSDETVSKTMFNPSVWTGKVHLSPCYVYHKVEGYRGTMKDLLVVEDVSIIHLDEFIVNKGQPDEEVYKFFRITAPYNFFNTSPSGVCGIAVKKS